MARHVQNFRSTLQVKRSNVLSRRLGYGYGGQHRSGVFSTDRVYRMASAMNGDPHYVVATIGRLAMTPNVPNAVPGHVELMLEVRSDSDAVLDQFPEELMTGVAGDLAALRLTALAAHVSRAKPTQCQPLVMDAVERSAANLGYASMRLPSGAGHDGVYVVSTGPIGMIFIPCLNGRSHCPEEWIEPRQLVDGTRVLYQTIRELDAVLGSASGR